MREHHVIWLTRRPVKERAEELLRYGYKVTFCQNIEDILKIFEKRRAGIIIISDDIEFGYSWVETLTHHPETRASRFILSLEQQNTGLYEYAASYNFRDLIPFSISNKSWCQRFIFAASTLAIESPQPTHVLGVQQVAKLNLPARIIWISPNMICLEGQIQPPIGSIIRIGGAIAQTLGLKVITGTVHRIQHRHLYYRFSTSILVHWRCPATPQAKQALHHLHQKDLGKRFRVLLVMSSSHNRRTIANRLNSKYYETHSLLRMKRLVQEVNFLSPHAIFIEAPLCRKPEFEQMMAVLDHDTPIFILGSPQEAGVDSTHITFLPHIPANPGALFGSEISDQSHNGKDAIYLQPHDEASFAKIILPTHITGVHPEHIEFSLPFKVNSFALAYMVSPFLHTTSQRGLWLKVTNIAPHNTENKKMHFKASAHLADLSAQEKYNLGTKLIQFYEEQLHYDWDKPENFSLPEVQPVIKKKPTKLPPKNGSLLKNLKYLFIFLAINLSVYTIFSLALPYLRESFEKSGSVYTDQIKKFQNRSK
ncbi:MAG: hypothetical protein AB8C84_05755 [Oligoflexales bacterium]